jgi:hypothetical protein
MYKETLMLNTELEKIKIGGRVMYHNTMKVIKDYYVHKGNLNLIFTDGTDTNDLGMKNVTLVFSSDEYNNIFKKNKE